MLPLVRRIVEDIVLDYARWREKIEILEVIAAGRRADSPPDEAENVQEDAQRLAADIERYVRWPGASGSERVKLLKLLWDLIGSEFGSRHVQYEMFYAGEPGAVKGREYRAFDWAAAERLVDQCLASYDLATPGGATDQTPASRPTASLAGPGAARRPGETPAP